MELELDLALPCRKRNLDTLSLFTDDGDPEIVGWPPVKGARRNDGRPWRARCVKVNMEGVAIGRKVDLSLHCSYQSLVCALGKMFPSYQDGELVKGGEHELIVTYEDGEGDCLLLGDVPWEGFLQSVKRLKVLTKRAD